MRMTPNGTRIARIAEKLSALGPVAEYVVEDILNEVLRATAKHPQWPSDPVHASAILNEEAGELTQAALDYHYGTKNEASHNLMHAGLQSMCEEAVQSGAMAVRFLLNMGSYATSKPKKGFPFTDSLKGYPGSVIIRKPPACGPSEATLTAGVRLFNEAFPAWFLPRERELEHTAYSLIVAERAKQFACGFDDAHDAARKKGELASMAAFFAVPGTVPLMEGFAIAPEVLLPECLRDSDKLNRSTEAYGVFGHIPARIRDLVKAGGCIVAEIERLQRAAGVNPETLED